MSQSQDVNPRIHSPWLGSRSIGGTRFSGVVISSGIWFGLGHFLPDVKWLGVIGLVPLAFGAWLLFQLYNRSTNALVPSFMACATIVMVCLFGLGTPQVGKHQRSVELLRHVQEADGAYVGTYGCLESSWVYYGKKPIVELDPARESSGSTQPPPSRTRFWHPKPRLPLDAFVKSDQPLLIITTQEFQQEIQKAYPAFRKVTSVPYFLKQQELFCSKTPRRVQPV